MLGQTESVFTRQVQIDQKNVNAGFLGANTMFAGRVLCAPTFCLATFFAVAATPLLWRYAPQRVRRHSGEGYSLWPADHTPAIVL